MGNKNEVRLQGRIVHMECKDDTTKGIIEVERNSGVIDRIPFTTKQKVSIHAEWVKLRGRLQTRNSKDKDGKVHKHMYVYAERISNQEIDCHHSENEIEFFGTLVHKDVLRKTPKGKTIMNIIVAINDEDRSQYPSVIVWGNVAENVDCLPIGTDLYIKGRFQSREYMKETENGVKVRTAYEISVSTAGVM